MNLTLSFLSRSDKLVIGQHLLLSPVNTVVKPAWSRICESSKSDSGGGVAMLSAESQVDVILGVWKNIGLTNMEVSSSVRSFGS